MNIYKIKSKSLTMLSQDCIPEELIPHRLMIQIHFRKSKLKKNYTTGSRTVRRGSVRRKKMKKKPNRT